MRAILVGLGSTLVLASAVSLHAGSSKPIDDAFIHLGQPDNNKGANADLVIRNTGTAGDRQAFIRFGLSAITEPVSTATLRLFVNQVGNEGSIASTSSRGPGTRPR